VIETVLAAFFSAFFSGIFYNAKGLSLILVAWTAANEGLSLKARGWLRIIIFGF
jgi:hypothetical protein